MRLRRVIIGVSEAALGLIGALAFVLVLLVLVAAIAPPLAGLLIVAVPVAVLVWLIRWIHPPPRTH